ncbi:MAG TPA: SIMPL domain-containing protein [Candidatus Paceibacterota bacterium]|nr:SIMPL domain-containing protein [Candidatus Paceibacterota bacterium]
MTDDTQRKTCEACGGAICAEHGICHECHGGHHGGALAFARGRNVRALLMLALLALALWGFAETASVIKGYRYIGSGVAPANTINVTGMGKVFAVPDVAQFSFSVMDTEKDVASAQAKVTDQMNSITDYLKQTAGIADTDIQTSDYSVAPKYQQTSCAAGVYCPQNTGTIIGYTVSETVTVKVKDTSKAGDVLSNVGSKGATNVSGLTFTVDNEDQLKQQARDKAIEDAQAKAKVLASQLGVSLVRVTSFYENGGPVIYEKAMSMGAADAAYAPAPANIQTGQNEIDSNVTITYEIQ